MADVMTGKTPEKGVVFARRSGEEMKD